MASVLTAADVQAVGQGYDPEPTRSSTIKADAYTQAQWFDFEQQAILTRSWQWACHVEALREPGAYIADEIAGRPILLVRGRDGELRGFYNVCRHRGHQLLSGQGQTRRITCPYHAWTYDLGGQLRVAPSTDKLEDFDKSQICLHQIAVEEFCGFVFANLDPQATPLAEQSGELRAEIMAYAPDVENLTFAHRLTYDIQANWKSVVDNFLECYHCHCAHKDFCSLVDMDTYEVTTHGIYSSHMAEAGKGENSAYAVDNATVREHAVWWLWPNTCMLRYPGRGNFIILNIIPVGPNRTLETYDFFFEEDTPNQDEREAIRYIDEVLQAEDISLVESVQKGMETPAFTQGRIVTDPERTGQMEHAVHHFHGLLLDAYKRNVGAVPA